MNGSGTIFTSLNLKILSSSIFLFVLIYKRFTLFVQLIKDVWKIWLQWLLEGNKNSANIFVDKYKAEGVYHDIHSTLLHLLFSLSWKIAIIVVAFALTKLCNLMQLTRKPFKAGLYSSAYAETSWKYDLIIKSLKNTMPEKYVYAKSYYVSFGIMLIYCIFDALAISLLPGWAWKMSIMHFSQNRQFLKKRFS